MKQTLLQLSEFIAALIGPTAEVVLHDLLEEKIYVYGNNAVTSRNLSEKDDKDTVRILKERAENCENGIMIEYDTENLRSTRCFIKDTDGALHYCICVNQNIMPMQEIQNFVDYFLNQGIPESSSPEPGDNTIDSLTTNLIFDEIRHMKYASIDTGTREAKIAIISRLNEKGVFDVRNSTAKVCRLLDISQATLYNYLKEIRAGDA